MASPQSTTGNAKDHLDAAKHDVKDAAGHTQQAASSAAQGMGQKARDTASSAGQQAKDMASNVGQKAQDMASNLSSKAKDAASTAEHKTDDALSSVGQGMSSLAGSIRTNAPHEGMLGSAASAVADRLDASGRYLSESGVREIGDDIADVVRSHPIPSLLTVFGIGFLAGMCARR
jgi:vacuolar-type H+-ATPase subunit H